MKHWLMTRTMSVDAEDVVLEGEEVLLLDGTNLHPTTHRRMSAEINPAVNLRSRLTGCTH